MVVQGVQKTLEIFRRQGVSDSGFGRKKLLIPTSNRPEIAVLVGVNLLGGNDVKVVVW